MEINALEAVLIDAQWCSPVVGSYLPPERTCSADVTPRQCIGKIRHFGRVYDVVLPTPHPCVRILWTTQTPVEFGTPLAISEADGAHAAPLPMTHKTDPSLQQILAPCDGFLRILDASGQPFCQPGRRIKKGDILGVVEVMKLGVDILYEDAHEAEFVAYHHVDAVHRGDVVCSLKPVLPESIEEHAQDATCQTYELKQIAHIRSPFASKMGIPRQSGLVEKIQSTIVFEPEFRVSEALRGIEGYSHLWLIWGFSENRRAGWQPTVRPPRLGGNVRMGVFATRSSFRPNGIGLSCVRLARLENTSDRGTVIHVLGADLMDGTPIYDIKPYLSFTDAHPEALNGFAEQVQEKKLAVVCSRDMAKPLDDAHYAMLCEILAQDPRPAYQKDPERIYGFGFDRHEVRFRVDGDILYVTEIV